jgi:hypothetical protein
LFKNSENSTVAFDDHCNLTPKKLNAIGVSKKYILTLDSSKKKLPCFLVKHCTQMTHLKK